MDERALSPEDLSVGDVVRTWHDTGAFGMTLLWGRVYRVGRRTFGVLWESGLRSKRIRFAEPRGVGRELNNGVVAEVLAGMRAHGLVPENEATGARTRTPER